MKRPAASLRLQLQSSIREIVFGMEDSLVSTLGVVTGIAAGTGDAFVVILSGVVLIVVEAISMAAGSYLSSKSAAEVFEIRQQEDASRLLQEPIAHGGTLHELLTRHHLSEQQIEGVVEAIARERRVWVKELRHCEARYAPGASTTPVRAAVVMGLFYVTGGLFPLVPYLLLPVEIAIIPSIACTAIALFLLGVWKAKLTRGVWWKSGIEMTSISLTAALLGFAIGRAFSVLFGVEVI